MNSYHNWLRLGTSIMLAVSLAYSAVAQDAFKLSLRPDLTLDAGGAVSCLHWYNASKTLFSGTLEGQVVSWGLNPRQTFDFRYSLDADPLAVLSLVSQESYILPVGFKNCAILFSKEGARYSSSTLQAQTDGKRKLKQDCHSKFFAIRGKGQISVLKDKGPVHIPVNAESFAWITSQRLPKLAIVEKDSTTALPKSRLILSNLDGQTYEEAMFHKVNPIDLVGGAEDGLLFFIDSQAALHLWDTESTLTFKEHSGYSFKSFSPSGDYFIGYSPSTGKISLFDVDGSQLVSTQIGKNIKYINVDCSDNKRVAIAFDDGNNATTILYWDASKASDPLKAHAASEASTIRRIAVHPVENKVALLNQDNTLQILSASLNSPNISAANENAAIGGNQSTSSARMTDISTSRGSDFGSESDANDVDISAAPVRANSANATIDIVYCAFSPNGKYRVAIDDWITIYDGMTDKELIKSKLPITSLACVDLLYDADDKPQVLVAASSDGVISKYLATWSKLVPEELKLENLCEQAIDDKTITKLIVREARVLAVGNNVTTLLTEIKSNATSDLVCEQDWETSKDAIAALGKDSKNVIRATTTGRIAKEVIASKGVWKVDSNLTQLIDTATDNCFIVSKKAVYAFNRKTRLLTRVFDVETTLVAANANGDRIAYIQKKDEAFKLHLYGMNNSKVAWHHMLDLENEPSSIALSDTPNMLVVATNDNEICLYPYSDSGILSPVKAQGETQPQIDLECLSNDTAEVVVCINRVGKVSTRTLSVAPRAEYTTSHEEVPEKWTFVNVFDSQKWIAARGKNLFRAAWPVEPDEVWPHIIGITTSKIASPNVPAVGTILDNRAGKKAVVVAGKNNQIFRSDPGGTTYTEYELEGSNAIYSMTSSGNISFAIAGRGVPSRPSDKNYLTAFQLDNPSMQVQLLGHSSSVMATVCNNDGILVTLDESGRLFIWDLRGWNMSSTQPPNWTLELNDIAPMSMELISVDTPNRFLIAIGDEMGKINMVEVLATSQ